MVQSLNTKVDLAIEATAFTGFADYGKIMIGDKGFEFYNSRDSHKYIQIPWEEVDYVIASVLLKGKWIPRYAIRTKKNGTYTFSSKEATKVLRAVRNYVDPDRMVYSLSFFDVVKRAVKSIFKKSWSTKEVIMLVDPTQYIGIKEGAIERRYYESLENLKILIPVCDEINIYDNTKRIEEIAYIVKGNLKWISENMPV